MENVAEEMIHEIQRTIATRERELSECGMFDVLDKHYLRKEIEALKEQLQPLLKTSLAQRQ